MSYLNYLSRNLLISVILLASCGRSREPLTETAAEVIPDNIVEMRFDQVKMAGIDTGTIKMRVLSNTISVNGIIAAPPSDLATVCSPLGGFVKSSSLLPGNQVAKGQTLAIIENSEFVDIQQNYLESRNRLEFAEAEYKRHTDLYKEAVYSEQNLQEVTANYKALRAQVSGLEQKLQLIGIDPAVVNEGNISRSVALRSPISGYVKSVNVNIGKSLSPTDVLFEIVNNDNLFLELTLFEKDANKVSKGQKIRFFINNEAEEHEAVIYQTGRSVASDKSYKVYATITKGCANLLSGMYVNAVIETSSEKIASLPSDAIVTFDDKDYIFVFERNKEEAGNPFTEYRIVEVTKGITEGGYTGVILPEGFDISSRIVTKGAYNLLAAKKNAGEMAC